MPYIGINALFILGIQPLPASGLANTVEHRFQILPQQIQPVLAKMRLLFRSEFAFQKIRRALNNSLESQLNVMAVEKENRVDQKILVAAIFQRV